MKTSERVLLMREQFMDLHNEGYTIAEIAEKFDLSVCSIYANLQKIADANGVPRESLLLHVHKAHVMTASHKSEAVEKLDPYILKDDFSKLHNDLRKITETLNDILKQEEI